MKTEENLLTYACEKFEKEEYEEALEAFILAYSKGYEREWILENIYNCYMAGNEAEFRKAYEMRTNIEAVDYKDCTLDFIPYRNGEYYIYDKEKDAFLGLLSAYEIQTSKPDSIFENLEFSAIALALDWDIRSQADILAMSGQRKIYIICHDMKRYMSFWKVPELRICLKDITVFSDYEAFQTYFHENTSVYLPMILCGSEEERKCLERIREEEHQYRLTPQGRNTENVLLTIAIPTAHRGNLLLKRLENLLSMPYDSEIEIAVSKNGNDLYEEEYKQVDEIEDARLRYYDHGKELKVYQSFHYAVEMSCGKYVMLVSDEDDVIIDALEHYLRLLDRNPELCLVRARSTFEYLGITKREFGEKGLEAFKVMFLRQAYISGLIVRRKDFIEADFLNELKGFTRNVFFMYYPHECWCALLCRCGDALLEPEMLILEGEPAREKEEETGGVELFPSYSTYHARLDQLQGQIEFLKFMMEDDRAGIEAGLALVVKKSFLSFQLARNSGYDSENYPYMVTKLMSDCIKALKEFSLNDEQEVRLLNIVKNCCLEALDLDIELRTRAVRQLESFDGIF